MNAAVETLFGMTSEDIHAALLNEAQIIPGVENADVADDIVGLMFGTRTLKDIQGMDAGSMEGIYPPRLQQLPGRAFCRCGEIIRFSDAL